MADNLVIVESPAKAKTIKKYLGKDFDVLASYGHVRDLVPKEGAVDPDHGFAMHYQVIEKNEKHVDAIARALRKAKALYLATDPDREGEAISWHMQEILQAARRRSTASTCIASCSTRSRRTRSRKPSPQPRELSLDLVNAQQARRALDYLVGFNLSPVLWRKVQRGLSAGRVQSPALRMICEREEEIAAFKAREYWTIEAECAHPDAAVPAKLIEYQRQEIRAVQLHQRGAGARRRADHRGAARETARTARLGSQRHRDRTQAAAAQSRRRRSRPRRCSRKPRASSASTPAARCGSRSSSTKAWRSARGSVGLITYMRTDSVILADEAMQRDPRRDRRDLRQGRALPKSRTSTRRSRRTRRKRTRRSGRRPRRITPADVEGKIDRRPAQALRADLEARGRLPDEPRDVRHGRRSTLAGRTARSARSARQRHDPRRTGLHRRLRGRHATTPKTDDDDRKLPAMNEGDAVPLRDIARRPAFHRAAAALFGSLAGQGAGGIRHRPAVDLREHHPDAAESRIRGARQPPLHADRRRQDRQSLPDQAFPPATSITTSPPSSKTSSTRSAAARKTGRRRWRILEAVQGRRSRRPRRT